MADHQFLEALPEISDKIKDILKSNEIHDEVSEVLMEVDPASLKGTGMASLPTYILVNFVDPKVNSLHMFVKKHTAVEVHAELHKAMKLFEKEARFFTEYVPAIKEFCKEKGQEKMIDFYPKCYYGDREMIIFENLVEKGYILLNKKDRQGLESSKLAFISLAKHHAISYAYVKHIGGPNVFIEKFPNLDYESFEHEMVKALVEPLIENGIATNIKIIEKSNVAGGEEALAILNANVGKGWEKVTGALRYKPEDEKVLTLNHGDYWNNNMMFLRDSNNKLYGHIMFDLQIPRYNSPALDIGNFMFTSMKPEIRRAHLKELLEVYLETFLDTTKKLGAPVEMSYDEFFHLFRRKVLYGFWFSIWLSAEAAYEVINDVEHMDNNDIGDWSVQFDKKVQKWIDENPEKSKEDAESLVELMREYASLAL